MQNITVVEISGQLRKVSDEASMSWAHIWKLCKNFIEGIEVINVHNEKQNRQL